MSVYLPKKYLRKEQRVTIKNDLKVNPEYNPFAAKKGFKPIPVCGFQEEKEGFYVPLGYGFQNHSKVIRKNIDNVVPSVEVKYNITDTDNLYDYQQYFLDEGMQKIQKKRTTFFALHTGAGKTKLGTHFSALMETLTCVVYYGKPIGIQWYEAFRQNTDAQVWFVGETKFDNKKITKPKHPDVILCSVGRIKNLSDENIDDIGFVIVDEAHQWVTQIRVNNLLRFKPDYMLGLSATPHKKKNLSALTVLFFNEIDLVKAMDKPHRTFKVLSKIYYSVDVKSKNIWDDIKKYYYRNKKRNDILGMLVKYLEDRKVLAITWDVQTSVIPFEKSLQKYQVEYDTFCGNKKSYENKQTLLGTIGKTGTGFDQNKVICKGYDGVRFDALILIGSTKDAGLYEQVVGRVSRAKEFDVYYIVDDCTTIERHFNKCKVWEKSHAGNVYEVDISKALEVNDIHKAFKKAKCLHLQKLPEKQR